MTEMVSPDILQREYDSILLANQLSPISLIAFGVVIGFVLSASLFVLDDLHRIIRDYLAKSRNGMGKDLSK